jgi:hypothetical protein
LVLDGVSVGLPAEGKPGEAAVSLTLRLGPQVVEAARTAAAARIAAAERAVREQALAFPEYAAAVAARQRLDDAGNQVAQLREVRDAKPSADELLADVGACARKKSDAAAQVALLEAELAGWQRERETARVLFSNALSQLASRAQLAEIGKADEARGRFAEAVASGSGTTPDLTQLVVEELVRGASSGLLTLPARLTSELLPERPTPLPVPGVPPWALPGAIAIDEFGQPAGPGIISG